jgi:hypothetical protein
LMQLRKIHTEKNPANMLTKLVPKDKLELCAGLADMISNQRLKIPVLSVLEWEVVGCTAPFGATPHMIKAYDGLVFLVTTRKK